MTTTRQRSIAATLLVVAMLATVLAVTPAAATSGACDSDHVSHHGTVWELSPSGGDDTANFQCALDEAAASGRRAIVALSDGDFYLDFVKVEGFWGTIRGEGDDETFVRPLAGGLDCVAELEAIGAIAWMAFLDSTLKMRDLALDIPDPACVEPWASGEDFPGGPGFAFQDFNIAVVVATRAPNEDPALSGGCGITRSGGLQVRRVAVTATFPDLTAPVFNPRGVFSAFRLSGTTLVDCPDEFDRLNGDLTIIHSSFDGIGNVIAAEAVTHGRMKVVKNHLGQVDLGFLAINNPRSTLRVEGNQAAEISSIGLVADGCSFTMAGVPDCLTDSMKVRVADNTMTVVGGLAGVLAVDSFAGPPQLHIRVKGNAISLDGALTGVLLDGTDGALVKRNTIAGASEFGVLVDGATTGSFVAFNKMRDLDAAVAGILLGEGTSMNRVRNNPGATVVDLGTGNNVSGNVPSSLLMAAVDGAGSERVATSGFGRMHWTTIN